MKELDVLLVSPLGWSAHIWDKVLPVLKGKQIAVLTFLDDSYEQITKEKMEAQLASDLNRLKDDGIIMAASYGVAVFVHYLSTHDSYFNQVVLVDGFASFPTKEELNRLAESLPTNQFVTLQDYYDMMLSEQEKQDKLLLSILNHNLINIDDTYRTKLSNANLVNYLSCYPDYHVVDHLEVIKEKVQNLIVYSSSHLPIPYESILPTDHLLMLTKPEIMIEKLQNL